MNLIEVLRMSNYRETFFKWKHVSIFAVVQLKTVVALQ